MKSRNDPMDLSQRLLDATAKHPEVADLLIEASGFLAGQFTALNDHDALIETLSAKLGVDTTGKDLDVVAADVTAALEVAVTPKDVSGLAVADGV